MKKFMKMSGILFLALALACTTAVAVDAGKEASAATAKTLKMKKKKASVTVGKKITLKVTVKPKKATIKWSSNKKKIATVSKKGVVTGKKAGTAKITAKSGKKKATCTVSVKAAPAGIKSIAVTNPKVVRVTLTKAASLAAGDFAVKKKQNAKGAYNTALKVGSITKLSSTVYELNLATDTKLGGTASSLEDVNFVESGEYVQVTVKKLKGTQTGEAVYYQSNYARNRYISGSVGKKLERSFRFSQTCVGYPSGVKFSNVPAGLTAKLNGKNIVVTGIPTTAKASLMTVTAKDELGKSLTQNVYFYIGSETVMLSWTETEDRTILANDENSEYFEVYTVGGSGDYTLSLNNNQNKFIGIEYGDICFKRAEVNENGSRTTLAAGTYNVSYTVKDNVKNYTNTGTLSVKAVNGVIISGKVTAGDNTALKSAYVYAGFEDEKNEYYSNGFSANMYSAEYNSSDVYSTAKKTDGDYNMMVYPSQIYSMEASKDNTTVYAMQRVTANATFNFQLPIYKVTVTTDGKNAITNTTWYPASGSSYYGENALYLPKGTYDLSTKNPNNYWDDEEPFEYYTAKFTVNGNMTVTATKTVTVPVKATLTLDTAATVALAADSYVYCAFTPTASGYYKATMTGLTDAASIRVYRGTSSYGAIAGGSSDGEDGILETTSGYMEAGKTYYVRLYSDVNNSNAKLTISAGSYEDSDDY